jgi:hypothetical protein
MTLHKHDSNELFGTRTVMEFVMSEEVYAEHAHEVFELIANMRRNSRNFVPVQFRLVRSASTTKEE